VFLLGSILGDNLNKLGLNFPLNSYRWKNLTQDRIVGTDVIAKCFDGYEIDLSKGIQDTLKWQKKRD